jgi:hypothetical protein
MKALTLFLVTILILIVPLFSATTVDYGLTFTRENITTANQNSTNKNIEILAEIALQQATLLPYEEDTD